MRADLELLLSEAPPFYSNYLKQVPEGEFESLLMAQLPVIEAAFSSVEPEKQNDGYAAGKWSPKEMLGHLLDMERVFQYRLMVIARGDQTPMPGVEEDDYVLAANFNDRSMENLLEEFAAVRTSTVFLIKSLNEDLLKRGGIANGKPVTARAIAAMLYGHPAHHLSVLKEKYLSLMSK